MERAHDYFEHDADIGIIGRGKTVEASFENAARAMFAIQCDIDSIRPLEQVEVNFEEDEVELALVRWLNALLAASRERGLAPCDFGLERSGECWRGWARGERWREAVTRGTEVKGATLTMLSVSQGPAGWEARCVVDV
ncbi:MAG: archease [Betaproteobacteria bacterium RIFCSPLOWO2_12_FULL_63_13]|nr:MAG: archease [Betaproteobacteria bacterium RIFCSPLOWO2_02_FULL_63_19]OGA50376.1 MAG: archease [Betaproteobacteria bacterium RIFCSPLOWO2_12_FULL_63_13]